MNLKRIFKFLFERPILVLFVLIIILYVPGVSVMQAQSVEKLIVRIMGIDKVEDDYEITLLYFQPSTVQAFSDNFMTISVKDKTITEALNKAADYTGKEIGLSHLSDVIISNEVAETDFLNSIDHLIRRFSVSNSTNVVNCTSSAKEFLTTTIKLQSSSTREADIIEHNNNYVVGERSDLELVVKSIYAPSKTAFVDIVRLSEEEGVNIEPSGDSGSSGGSSGGEGQGGGNSSNGESKNKKLVNDGSVAIICNGKKVGELTRKEVINWNAINEKSIFNKLKIENYSDENMQDATVVINVINKKVTKKAYFDNETPTICFNIGIQGNVFEIQQNSTSIKSYLSDKPLLNEKMSRAFIDQIKADFYSTYLKLQSLNADPNNFYDLFNKQYHKEFHAFLKSLKNEEDYIKNIKIVLNIQIQDR